MKRKQETIQIKDMVLINKLLIIVLLFCCSCENQERPSIKISYVNMETETPRKINCDDFEVAFTSDIKRVIIKEDKDIDSILELLKSLKKDPSDYQPNVRVVIEIEYNSKSKVYCLSESRVCCDGISYFSPDKLLKILEKYMEKVEE